MLNKSFVAKIVLNFINRKDLSHSWLIWMLSETSECLKGKQADLILHKFGYKIQLIL